LEAEELAELEDRILQIVAFEIWDDSTKTSLDCYLKLRGIPYLVEDHLTIDGTLRLVLKINGTIRSLSIPKGS
jgi:hypothetical protein